MTTTEQPVLTIAPGSALHITGITGLTHDTVGDAVEVLRDVLRSGVSVVLVDRIRPGNGMSGTRFDPHHVFDDRLPAAVAEMVGRNPAAVLEEDGPHGPHVVPVVTSD